MPDIVYFNYYKIVAKDVIKSDSSWFEVETR